MQTEKILTLKIFGYVWTKLCCSSLRNPLLVPLANASTAGCHFCRFNTQVNQNS